MKIICDFETASAVDLKAAGAWVYAAHPSTEILCLVWKHHGADRFGVWAPLLPEYEDTSELMALAADPGVTFVSHAAFEQAIWHHIMVPAGFPPLPPERWEDTQAAAAWRNLPLKLETVSKVLGLAVQKDMEGSRLTISLSRPNKKTEMLDRRPETLRRVVQYCQTDVAGEEQLLDRLGGLSPAERKVWLLDQEINQRGVMIDLDFVRQAQQVVERASVPLLAEFRDLTGGVNPGQRDKVIGWCAGQGVELENLQKGTIAELLGSDNEDGNPTAGYGSLAGDDDDVLPGQSTVCLTADVRRVLEIRQMLGSASIKKLARMLACTGADSRARGLTQYHAAGTGRWGGRLLQPQNFPWDKDGAVNRAIDPDAAVAAILSGDPDYVEIAMGCPAITAVSLSLRHALVAAPGHTFLVGDYAGIEARLILALAGQHDKCELLSSGFDVYLDMAEDIYNQPKGSWAVTDKVLLKAIKEEHGAERTIGKNSVLGCGFQMGGAKFHARYCNTQPLAFAEGVVDAYRTKWAPKVPELWQAFKDAVYGCIAHGKRVETYGCTFTHHGDFMSIDLPSGWQRLWYFAPAMREKIWPDGETSREPSYKAQKNGRWGTIFLYGGIIAENVIQALARGLLCTAMGRLTQAGMPVVMTVHDEIICEVPAIGADFKRFQSIMAQSTDWSDRIKAPIAVDGAPMSRYRK